MTFWVKKFSKISKNAGGAPLPSESCVGYPPLHPLLFVLDIFKWLKSQRYSKINFDLTWIFFKITISKYQIWGWLVLIKVVLIKKYIAQKIIFVSFTPLPPSILAPSEFNGSPKNLACWYNQETIIIHYIL